MSEKCTDTQNCGALASVMQITNIKRDRMISDPEFMFCAYIVKDDAGPIFFRFCPFCGYKFGEGM